MGLFYYSRINFDFIRSYSALVITLSLYNFANFSNLSNSSTPTESPPQNSDISNAMNHVRPKNTPNIDNMIIAVLVPPVTPRAFAIKIGIAKNAPNINATHNITINATMYSISFPPLVIYMDIIAQLYPIFNSGAYCKNILFL